MMRRPKPRRSSSSWLRACLFALSTLIFADIEVHASVQQPDPELAALLRQTVNDAASFPDRFEAEVWLVDMSARLSRYVKDHDERLQFLKLLHFEATKAGLSPELVLAVIHVESLFDRFAISSVGAQGAMQVMPFWKNEIGRPDDNLMDMATNLRYGCTILKHYIHRSKGNLTEALARYNGSYGRIKYPVKVFDRWEKYWFVNGK